MKNLLALVFASAIAASEAYALEGEWDFEDIFSQAAFTDSAISEPLEMEVIKTIIFTNQIAESGGNAKAAEVVMMDSTGKRERYNAQYIAGVDAFSLSIKDDRNTQLIVYTASASEGRMWYAYAISADGIPINVIGSPRNNDINHVNKLGIMTRVK